MAKNKIFGALLLASSCFLASCATTGTISGVEVTETHFGQHEMVIENKRISKIISPVYQSSNNAKEITNKAIR